MFKIFKQKEKSKNSKELLDYPQLLARHIVLKEIGKKLYTDKNGEGITVNSGKHLHVVIYGNDDLLLYIARQIALLCHFPNFDDRTGENRSLITFVIPNKDDLENTVKRFKDKKITGNLLKLGAYWDSRIVTTDSSQIVERSGVEQSFLDFEFSFVALDNISFSNYVEKKYSNRDESVISSFICLKDSLSEELNTAYFDNICMIDEMDFKGKDITLKQEDINRAKLVNTVYNMGSKLLYIKDMYAVEQYKIIIDILCKYTSSRKINGFWNNKNMSTNDKLSSLFCADCFDVKLNSLSKNGIDDVNISNLIKDNIVALAISEHARWNMEKFILGYSPYTVEQIYNDINLSSQKRSAERKRLKKEKSTHINLCSYGQLKRIDYENFKYDCFLILSMDKIIKKANK